MDLQSKFILNTFSNHFLCSNPPSKMANTWTGAAMTHQKELDIDVILLIIFKSFNYSDVFD
jgi:hypothetical protein